ncbi:hypothetical protein N7532_004009 [Penicillium argentinense]|uniref:Zn(2)-C6 fungal-type domain-containing protein n=1 Tax=Penicillium argentinense TaxID=1131581 RepID=A0A9W9FNJ3_9EURO|nr:uncharacterized protein N7532_004009 [Penicillium argentinense]KAJ5103480.1 hypothetical protein N7532_004009 [Penicillium argentinense]
MTKGCYTCRRRRIICDNGQPTCRKCRDAGKECLGYQKPLVWVKGGVASRGKMMGRSFDDVNKADDNTKSQNPPLQSHAPIPTNTSGFSVFSVAESSSDNDSPSSGTQTSPEADTYTQDTSDQPIFEPVEEETMQDFNMPEDMTSTLVQMGHVHSVELNHVPSPWGLVDPLFKDLSRFSRFYLHHYNQCVAGDFVVYAGSKNPWRDIISLVGDSPLLAHALSSMGALHYSLTTNSDSSTMPWSTQGLATDDSQLTPEQIESFISPTGLRRTPSKAFEHFLEFKQRTLNQLSKDLRNPVSQKDDRTLAAIIVLALLDLFESGSGAWSYHIEGAKKLLRDRPENELGQGILQGLESFAVDGCLIMEIMGSTLARPGALSKPFYSTEMGPAMLKRLEITSWIGCPAYLLEVIFFVHTLWYPDSEIAAAIPRPTALPMSMQQGRPLTLESYVALLQGIRSFDPVSWAHGMQQYHLLPDVTHRITLASAYQAAVYLYTSRVLSRSREGFSPPWTDVGVPSDHSTVANELITQLCSVPSSDPHFKCLIWPTFIAGAECRRPSQRALILERLGTLYHAVTSVNVRNAAWVLRLMWQNKDKKRRERGEYLDSEGRGMFENDELNDEEGDDTFDWIDMLDESRLDWLFI